MDLEKLVCSVCIVIVRVFFRIFIYLRPTASQIISINSELMRENSFTNFSMKAILPQ